MRRGSSEKWYIRVPSGEEYVTSAKNVEGAVEEDAWLQGTSGARLPHEVFARSGALERVKRCEVLGLDVKGLAERLRGGGGGSGSGVGAVRKGVDFEGEIARLAELREGPRRLEGLMASTGFEDVVPSVVGESLAAGGSGDWALQRVPYRSLAQINQMQRLQGRFAASLRV